MTCPPAPPARVVVPLPPLLAAVGHVYRRLPAVRGKYAVAQRLLAPLLRGRGYRTVVSMRNAGGGRLVCCLDDWIPWNVFAFGRYLAEASYERFMLSCVHDTPATIFDIGANIGYYAVQFARVACPPATVHAFEPVSAQAALLRENVGLNRLHNVVINQAAVSDRAGAQRIYVAAGSNTGQSSLARVSPHSEQVDTVTVDEYCASRSIARIDLVKIDVEGHELQVLKGMAGMLRDGRVARVCTEAEADLLAANQASGLSPRLYSMV